MSVHVLALVGSLRAASTNRKLAETAAQVAPEGVTVTIYEGLAQIPFYNEDLDVADDVPGAAARLREAAGKADAVLLVTPEYNGTLPAVLKNGIDWLSRPFGAGALTGKPVAVVGTSFGQYGGVWAHDDARKSAGIAGANVLAEAKLSVPESLTRFAESHPSEDDEVTAGLAKVFEQVLAELKAPAA
jgi:NAD(P)H-dependent FMN reductase